MFYNNILSLPIVVVVCYVNGDFAAIPVYPYLWDLGFWLTFLFSSVQAFLLNYSIFLCTKTNSALTTSVTGQVKNILTTAGGYFMFGMPLVVNGQPPTCCPLLTFLLLTGDVAYNLMNVCGLYMGVVTSVCYSYFQFVEEAHTRREKERVEREKAALAAGGPAEVLLMVAAPASGAPSSAPEEGGSKQS